jgi:hypothetical protein
VAKAKRLREQRAKERTEQRQEVSASASLDGPIAKLDRAKTHFQALNKSIGAFKRSKTHDFIVTKFDPNTGEQVVNLKILKEPKNPEWGLVLGDMVHNLRSALDHLVWQLVILNGKKPRRQNQFPIIGAKNEYWEVPADRSESVRDRMLIGVAEDHRAFIDAVQPFNARGDPSSVSKTSLSILSWVSNADKHRVIHAGFVLTGEPSVDLFDITTPHPGGAAVNMQMNWGELKDGAEIMRFRPDPPGAQVNVNAEIPTYIAFRQGGRDLRAEDIKVLFNWIDAYVRGFEPIFRGELAMGNGSPIKAVPGDKAP